MLKYLLVITVSLSFAAADGMRWKRVVKAGDVMRWKRVAKTDGNWDAWTNWSKCSSTCGLSKKIRKRNCHSASYGGNRTCPTEGLGVELQDCNHPVCKAWSEWENQGDCSVSCGNGTLPRSRTCENEITNEVLGNALCGTEAANEVVECNTEPCPAWSIWKPNGPCDVTCGGGKQSVTRQCRDSRYNKLITPESKCGPEPSVELHECNSQQCPIWSDWSGEESCPSPCWGTYSKSRTCRDPNKDNATILAEKCGTEPDTVDNVDCPVNDTCWKVIQSRGQHGNGADYFMRTWAEYVAGFGVEGKEYWLGLQKIYEITNAHSHMLRVGLTAFDNDFAEANYSSFRLTENVGYTLAVSGYSGTAGDSLSTHDGHTFKTKDRSPLNTCPTRVSGAWWYVGCYASNLNGLNAIGQRYSIDWSTFKGVGGSLKEVEMAIKEVGPA